MDSRIEDSAIKISKHVTMLLLCVLLLGCEDQGTSPTIDEGTYIGVFSIRLADGTEQSGGVTFLFRSGTYSCWPERLYLPPSGGGTYKISGSTIVLADTAAHTAEFDWSLILGGPFSLSFSLDRKTLTLIQNDTRYQRYRTMVLTYRQP